MFSHGQVRAPSLEAAVATQAFSLKDLTQMRKPRIFKTHADWKDLPISGCSSETPPPGVRVVVVIRDPADIMASLYYHSRAIKGISYQGSWHDWFQLFVYESPPLPTVSGGGVLSSSESDALTGIEQWCAHTAGWWRVAQCCPGQVLWVQYEAMVREPSRQVQEMGRFLGVECSDSRAEQIARYSSFDAMKEQHETPLNSQLRNVGEASHFRNGKVGDGHAHMTAQEKRVFKEKLAASLHDAGMSCKHAPWLADYL